MNPRRARAIAQVCALVIGAIATPIPAAHAGSAKPACSKADEAKAKEHYERGEAFKTLKKYPEAANEYQTAFERCARPFLLFNAGQMMWLDGQKLEALKLYKRYLELDPDSRAAPVAREQFFEFAEDLRKYKKLSKALAAYQLYLELAPEGDNIEAAKIRIKRLQEAIETREADRRERRPLEPTAADNPRERRDSAGAWMPWTTLGTGAVLVAVGGLVHSQALSRGQEYDAGLTAMCPAGCTDAQIPAELTATLDSARSRQSLAIGAYVTGGLIAGAGVAWLLMRSSGGDSARTAANPRAPQFIPMVGAGVVGATVRLGF